MLAASDICIMRRRARRARVADLRRSLAAIGGELGCEDEAEAGRSSSLSFHGFKKDNIGLLSVRTSCRDTFAFELRVGLLSAELVAEGEVTRLGECISTRLWQVYAMCDGMVCEVPACVLRCLPATRTPRPSYTQVCSSGEVVVKV